MIRLPARLSGPFRLIGSGSTLFLLYTSLQLLLEPGADQGAYAYDFAVLIGFEFVLNPLNLGLLAISRSWWGTLCVLGFFAGFVLAFASFMVDPRTMAYLIGSVLLVHFIPLLQPSDEQRQMAVLAIVGRISLYFLALVACCMLSPLLPRLGMDDAWMQSVRYDEIKRNGGLLLDTPHVSAWIGVLYYGGILATQLLVLGYGIRQRLLGKPTGLLAVDAAKVAKSTS